MKRPQTPYQFFKAHAGYSYDPKTETAEQGKRRGARLLAHAEAHASREGYSFVWEVDHESLSSDWLEDHEDGGKFNDPWSTWGCRILDPNGKTVGSLWSIDFGRNGKPWGQPYKRVVEAELALEHLD